MKTFTHTVAVAVLGLGLTTAHADPLAFNPMQAQTFDLGTHTAVVYYVHSAHGYEVVTTVGPNLGHGGPITGTAPIFCPVRAIR